MAKLDRLVFRAARATDAAAIAGLHTESWRLHYRGAYTVATPMPTAERSGTAG